MILAATIVGFPGELSGLVVIWGLIMAAGLCRSLANGSEKSDHSFRHRAAQQRPMPF